MTIRRQMTEMPAQQGNPPDESSAVGALYGAHLDALATDRRSTPAGPRDYVRPSDALGCARALSYVGLGLDDASEPMDAVGQFTVDLGTTIHRQMQEVLSDAGWSVEVPIGETVEDDTHRGDRRPAMVETLGGRRVPVFGFVDFENETTAGDLKTVGGYAYKLAVGERNAPEGPKPGAVMQAAIGAIAHGKDLVSVVNVAKEPISIAIAQRKGLGTIDRFIAEWTVPLADIRADVDAELERMDDILRLAERNVLAKRVIPGVPAEIADPGTGSWSTTDDDGNLTATGTAWNCGYCRWRTICEKDGPGRVEL